MKTRVQTLHSKLVCFFHRTEITKPRAYIPPKRTIPTQADPVRIFDIWADFSQIPRNRRTIRLEPRRLGVTQTGCAELPPLFSLLTFPLRWARKRIWRIGAVRRWRAAEPDRRAPPRSRRRGERAFVEAGLDRYPLTQ